MKWNIVIFIVVAPSVGAARSSPSDADLIYIWRDLTRERTRRQAELPWRTTRRDQFLVR
jgi:hypothetical protein